MAEIGDAIKNSALLFGLEKKIKPLISLLNNGAIQYFLEILVICYLHNLSKQSRRG